MAEVQHCRRVRNYRHRQIDAGKAAQRFAVIERVFQGLVGIGCTEVAAIALGRL
jgi:hypothetical protein